jgi:hypothetical protein
MLKVFTESGVFKMNPSDLADPNCEECGGEGVCEYAEPYTSGENSVEGLCDTCPQLKDLCEDDFAPDEDRYEDD